MAQVVVEVGIVWQIGTGRDIAAMGIKLGGDVVVGVVKMGGNVAGVGVEMGGSGSGDVGVDWR